MKIKILLTILVLLTLPMLVSADSIGAFPQNTDVVLYQNCNNCTFCNITRVINQNDDTIVSNVEMTQDDTYFSYTLNAPNVTTLGDYKYCWKCGNSVENLARCTDFEISPGGRSGNTNIVFFLVILVLVYAVGFIGFFGKNIPISILGGMAMLSLGVYMIQQGFIIYRDWFTISLSYITIGIGAIFALVAVIEWIEEIM